MQSNISNTDNTCKDSLSGKNIPQVGLLVGSSLTTLMAKKKRGTEKEKKEKTLKTPIPTFQPVMSFHVLGRALKSFHELSIMTSLRRIRAVNSLTGYCRMKLSKWRIFKASKRKVKFIRNFNVIVSALQIRVDTSYYSATTTKDLLLLIKTLIYLRASWELRLKYCKRSWPGSRFQK